MRNQDEVEEKISYNNGGIFEFEDIRVKELQENTLNKLIRESLELNYEQFIDEITNNIIYSSEKDFFEKKKILESIRSHEEVFEEKKDKNIKLFFTRILERFFLLRNLPVFFLKQKEHIDKDLKKFEEEIKKDLCSQSLIKVYRIFSVMYSRIESGEENEEGEESEEIIKKKYYNLNRKILKTSESLSEEDKVISLNNEISFSVFESLSSDIFNIIKGNIENNFIWVNKSLEQSIEDNKENLNEVSDYIIKILFESTKDFLNTKIKQEIQKNLNGLGEKESYKEVNIKILINKFIENIETIKDSKNGYLIPRQVNMIFIFLKNYLLINYGTLIKKSIINPNDITSKDIGEINYLKENLLGNLKKLQDIQQDQREAKYIIYIVELLSNNINSKNNFFSISKIVQESLKDLEKEEKIENILNLIIKYNNNIETGSIEHIVYKNFFKDYNSYCDYQIKAGLLLNTIKKVDVHFSPGHTNRVGKLSKSMFSICKNNIDNFIDDSMYDTRYKSQINQITRNLTEQDIFILSLLHDLGKIETDWIDLSKESKLKYEEFLEVTSHAKRSFSSFEDFFADDKSIGKERRKFLRQSFHHHERLDGKGYPNKLEGKDIPFFSRIVTLADALDAIIFRRQKNLEGIKEDLEKNKGIQFDPLLVDIMISIINKINNKEVLSGNEKEISKYLITNEK